MRKEHVHSLHSLHSIHTSVGKLCGCPVLPQCMCFIVNCGPSRDWAARRMCIMGGHTLCQHRRYCEAAGNNRARWHCID